MQTTLQLSVNLALAFFTSCVTWLKSCGPSLETCESFTGRTCFNVKVKHPSDSIMCHCFLCRCFSCRCFLCRSFTSRCSTTRRISFSCFKTLCFTTRCFWSPCFVTRCFTTRCFTSIKPVERCLKSIRQCVRI